MKLRSLTVKSEDVNTDERSPVCWRIRPEQGLGENMKNTENERERTRERKRKADRPTAPSTEFNHREILVSVRFGYKRNNRTFPEILKYF